jgi:membrane-associated phospholipid phosphatase
MSGSGASREAAVAQAAHDALVALYPSQRSVFDAELAQVLNGVPANKGRAPGIAIGAAAAAHILAARANDGALQNNVPIYPLTSNPPLPGEHQPDPLHPAQGLLDPGWGRVTTFTGIDVTAPGVRVPPPPALGSAAYASAFEDVRTLGADGIITPTTRTPEQTDIGLFWAYDGTIGLGTPPVLYNDVLQVLAKQEKNTPIENARLFALANIAMADAGIACWDGKYFYNFWRPVIGQRNSGIDGNPATNAPLNWTPLGAPASNQTPGGNFTPPFPSYASGHATFGAALFRTLASFYGRDALPFQLKSDELRGFTTDSAGRHRRTVVRRFSRFSDASVENARSRIFLGIHWQFDADAGVDQGNLIADVAFASLLTPLP